MMKKIALILLSCIMLAACKGVPTLPYAGSVDINEIAPYPPAKPGYSRFAIFLPKLPQEGDYKVELLIGKDLIVDCNQKQLLGTVTKHSIAGWGYDYYVVDSKGHAVSTLKACPFQEETIQFVAIPNALGLISYNSRLPIVVYASNDMQVNYRIWSISNEMFSAIKQ